jgi:hypothetical protein
MLDASGEPTTGGTVRLMPSQGSTSVSAVPVGARIRPDGWFEFPKVPSGQYVIHADRGRSNSWTEGEFGMIPVIVNDADVTNLILQMGSGSSIHGRFAFETINNSKPPAPSAIEFSPMPVDLDLAPSSTATAAIHDDWTFDLAGINGPRRLTVLRTPAEWALKEIRVNGIDVTDLPLPFGRSNQSLSDVEVTLTDRINVFFPPAVRFVDVMRVTEPEHLSYGDVLRRYFRRDSALLIVVGRPLAGRPLDGKDEGIFYHPWTGTALKLVRFLRSDKKWCVDR